LQFLFLTSKSGGAVDACSRRVGCSDAQHGGGDSASKASAALPATHANSSDTSTEIEGVTVTAPKLDLTPTWTHKLDLDPDGGFAAPGAAYLRRRPTDGCKPMAGGRTDPMGKSGAAGGVVCVKRF
jgi:hypothetical protein